MYKNNNKYNNDDKTKLDDEQVLRQAKKNSEIFLPLEADGYCVHSQPCAFGELEHWVHPISPTSSP